MMLASGAFGSCCQKTARCYQIGCFSAERAGRDTFGLRVADKATSARVVSRLKTWQFVTL